MVPYTFDGGLPAEVKVNSVSVHAKSSKNTRTLMRSQFLLPKMRLHIAVRAIFIFWKDPKMWTFLQNITFHLIKSGSSFVIQNQVEVCLWTHVSARTILVFVTFSMVNFVFPPLPAILPTALDKWSPLRGLTVSGKEIKRQSKTIIDISRYKTYTRPWNIQMTKRTVTSFLRHCTTRRHYITGI